MKIYYKCKNKIIKEYSSDKFDLTFGELLDLFYNDLKQEYNQFELKSEYYHNNKKLEKKDVIINLLINDDINMYDVKEIIIELNLDEIYNLYDEEIVNYNRLIIPIRRDDYFQLYIYYPEKGTIDMQEYYKNIFDEYCLNKINDKTSWCNSHNYLFLSGGEYNNEILDDFWIINNKNYSIKHLQMPSKKTNHSMFNINDEFILIIGGNNKQTYLFNISKNFFIQWENMNNLHIKPSILFFNNNIYCFSIQNEKIICEKLSFSFIKKDWENIDLYLINWDMDFDIVKNNSLLLILENKKYFEFNPDKNTLKEIKINCEDNYELNICLNEKNSYKLSKYYNAYISDNFKDEKILYVINKKRRIIHKMNFEGKVYEIKKQYQDNFNKITNENNLIIITKSEDEVKENNPVIKVKNSKTLLKEIDGDENDITNLDNEIVINNLSLKKEEENGFGRKSSKNNNIKLIIPNNVQHEQFIQRTSHLDKNELKIDLNNLVDIDENIFTPIKRDLESPFGLAETKHDNQKKEESIIFEQSIENQSDNLLDLSHDIGRKKHFNFFLSNEIINEQILNREIKSQTIPKNIEINEEIKNNENKSTQHDEDKKDLINEDNNDNNINSREENNLHQSENREKEIDLFISTDAFAI